MSCAEYFAPRLERTSFSSKVIPCGYQHVYFTAKHETISAKLSDFFTRKFYELNSRDHSIARLNAVNMIEYNVNGFRAATA